MKPDEFVKKYGWEVAKEISKKGLTMKSAYFDTQKHEFFNGTPVRVGIDVKRVDFINNLKRLVESHELVDSLGGLDEAKKRCYPTKHLTMDSFYKLKQAVVDVESCQ